MRRAPEEIGSHLALQRPDLLTQRRLSDPDLFGGPAKTRLVGDGHEIAEMSKLHGYIENV